MQAPTGFADQVMEGVRKVSRDGVHKTNRQKGRVSDLFFPGNWLVPALAGALVMGFVWAGTSWLFSGRSEQQAMAATDAMNVTFELHAPDAERVELVGSFNGWKVGTINLDGPDATGYWTVNLDLEAGRYEYLFLVDGDEWVADPSATAVREDGFGSRNAVLQL
jgi:hypothetical protein